MAIGTAAQLETAVANWLARSDLSSRIPEFIALAEGKFRRRLKAVDQETKTASFSINAEYVNVPTDFQEVRAFSSSVGGERFTIEYKTLAEMDRLFDGTTGIPLYYCNVAGQFRFAPPPDATYTATLVYYITFTALASGSDTNWILTKFPDLYLYGALCEAAGEIQDDARVPMWKAGYEQALAEVNAKNAQNRWGANLQIRPG